MTSNARTRRTTFYLTDAEFAAFKAAAKAMNWPLSLWIAWAGLNSLGMPLTLRMREDLAEYEKAAPVSGAASPAASEDLEKLIRRQRGDDNEPR